MDKDASSIEIEMNTEPRYERFTSLLDKRRMERKEEENKEIEWAPLEKQDEATVVSRIDSIIDNFKQKFKEEKLARSRAQKVSQSYQLFCNGVDGFLRHHENAGGIVSYTEPDVASLGEEPENMKDTLEVSATKSVETNHVNETKFKVDNVYKEICCKTFSTMQDCIILSNSDITDCYEYFPVIAQSVSCKAPIHKQMRAKEDEYRSMPNTPVKAPRTNKCFTPLKQKVVANGSLNQPSFAPYLKTGSPFVKVCFGVAPVLLELCLIKDMKQILPSGQSGILIHAGHLVPFTYSKINCWTTLVNKCISSEQKPGILYDSKRKVSGQSDKTKRYVTACDIPVYMSHYLKRGTIIRDRASYTANKLAKVFEQDLLTARGKELVTLKHSCQIEDLRGNTCDVIRQLLTTLKESGDQKYHGHNNEKIIQKSIANISLKSKVTRSESECSISAYSLIKYPIEEEHINCTSPAVKLIDPSKNLSSDYLLTTGIFECNPPVQLEKMNDDDDDDDGDDDEDDDDDNSQFGIMSVYCRSGVHSR